MHWDKPVISIYHNLLFILLYLYNFIYICISFIRENYIKTKKKLLPENYLVDENKIKGA